VYRICATWPITPSIPRYVTVLMMERVKVLGCEPVSTKDIILVFSSKYAVLYQWLLKSKWDDHSYFDGLITGI
jgi:hypothetical protein